SASAIDADRHNPFYALGYARTLRFYGAAPEKIEAAFAETFNRWPVYPVARAEYARFLAEQGRMDEAREQLELASLVPDRTGGRDRAVQQTLQLLERN
ncbi:MAG TPA: hypothetical protein VLA05_11715, partial [Coriobacteriia bacterium]|nr:hypothetical protein [Coriobacteriia bacterium]